MTEGRPRSFYVLAIFFAAYVLFLYGPMIAIYVLSFQGPQGGLTFPMNGVSTFWLAKLFQGTGIVDLVYATTALGGGAAPTFGTIGGSGPATAAQNSWLKVRINATDSYIPIWR